MKKLFAIITAILLAATTWAQSPEKMSYQAVIRDASDQLLTNQDMGMQISILQGSIIGTPVYVETHSTTSNANGLVTIEIGTGTTSDDFSAIDWANDIYFIKTETDPTTSGGTNYTIKGSSQLLSVPYALHAKTVTNDQVNDADFDPTNELQSLSISNDTIFLENGDNIKLPICKELIDSDFDTKIQVEATDDEDVIRFDIAGIERWTMAGTRLEPKNTEGSLYIGENTGYNAVGNDNVFVGSHTGYNATGSDNIFIGSYAGSNETGSNRLYIDNTSTATPLLYGYFGDNSEYLTINGLLNVNEDNLRIVTNPGATANPVNYVYQGITGSTLKEYAFAINDALWVRSHVWIDGTQFSKKNYERINSKNKIRSFPVSCSLEKILMLNSEIFTEEIPHKENNTKELITGIGFTEESLEKQFQELIYVDKNGDKFFQYSGMSVILVEAIKEQQNLIEALQKENILLKVENKDFEERLKILEKFIEKLK